MSGPSLDPSAARCNVAADDAPPFECRMEIGDLVAGAALFAFAGLFWVLGGEIDNGGFGVGAADFPRGIALLLGVASLILFANAVLRLARGDTQEMLCIGRPARVAVGMALLIAFPPAMSHIGYYPAMALFMAALLWVADCRSPLRIVAYVAGFLVFSKVVFEMILSIPLP